MSEPVRLTVEWQVEPERIAVSYRVTNGGDQTVYVIDGRFQVQAGGEVAWSDRLQVALRPPETAVLSSRLLPLNPLATAAIPPSAFAVRVAAGESHQSTLTAPLPLVPDDLPLAPTFPLAGSLPNPPPPGAPAKPDREVTCREVEFALGVIPHHEALTPLPVVLAGRPVFRLAAAAWSLQRLLTVSTSVAGLPMLVVAGMEKEAP